jgi:hypothetical protein
VWSNPPVHPNRPQLRNPEKQLPKRQLKDERAMVDKVENSPDPDSPSTIEEKETKCAIRKCEIFGCQDIATQMCQVAPGTNVWLCDKCSKEMDKERVG